MSLSKKLLQNNYIFFFKKNIKISFSAKESMLNNTTALSCSDFYLCVLHIKFNFKNQHNTIFDYYHLNSKNLIFMVVTDLFKNEYITLVTKIKKNSTKSISNLYKGCIWLEREIFEFNKTLFVGLRDSRKLLLNYTTPKGVVYTDKHNFGSFCFKQHDLFF